MRCKQLLLSISVILCTNLIIAIFAHNDKGYIMYCPCMGRFGNQAEQLLGSLMFAKSLNRTLLLPSFIHYGLNHVPVFEPFEDIIQVEPITEYHDVMLLTDFMKNNAQSDWPLESRSFYCYSSRDPKGSTCGALKGQPFNSFWSHLNISEKSSVIYKPLIANPKLAEDWIRLYPPSTHKVITFVGAPSPFPTHREAIKIQKHLVISDYIRNKAMKFKESIGFAEKPYLSMHIRHGSDWKKACQMLKQEPGLKEFFSSNQCTKYDTDEPPFKDIIHFDTCLPSLETITTKLAVTLENYKETKGIEVEVVHIATDFTDLALEDQLKASFPHVKFFTTPRTPTTIVGAMMDIYLMAYADIFIGNCVSSFSAFAARIRSEQLGLSNEYFGQDFNQVTYRDEIHEDL